MNHKTHRLGVSEVNLVVRHLKLEVTSASALQEALLEVNKLYGLDDITFDEKSQVLNLAYDASRICLDGIEGVLRGYRVEVGHDWWTTFKEGYYKFVDENVKANAEHEPLSCHKTPPDSRTKR